MYLLDSFWGSKSTLCSHDLLLFPRGRSPVWPRKRIAVGQAQGQVFALKLAEKLAREACFSVMDNRYFLDIHGFHEKIKASRKKCFSEIYSRLTEMNILMYMRINEYQWMLMYIKGYYLTDKHISITDWIYMQIK